MNVIYVNDNEYCLLLDGKEVTFLENEAKENHLTITEILSMLVGMLFISGYRKIVGKD